MSSALAVSSQTFESEVLNATTPVLVDFWAGWCMPCRMLAPTVDEIAADFAGKVKVVKVDVDQEQGLAAKYGIQGIPALFVFKNGQIVSRMVGAQPKQAIAQSLNEVLKT